MSHLTDLIHNWESYTASHKNGTIYTFAEWLIQQNDHKHIQRFEAVDMALHTKDNNTDLQKKQTIFLLGKMSQYLHVYAKPIMKKYKLHSIQDFGYLASVFWHKEISKSKVIEVNLGETTTGFDIIRRLIRLQLIKEKLNTNDKREKLLQITTKGIQTIQKIQDDFNTIPDVLGDLKNTERNNMIALLQRMDEYHDRVVKSKK